MNYELIVYLIIGVVIGRISKLSFYYGYDKDKYDKAYIGILRIRK